MADLPALRDARAGGRHRALGVALLVMLALPCVSPAGGVQVRTLDGRHAGLGEFLSADKLFDANARLRAFIDGPISAADVESYIAGAP